MKKENKALGLAITIDNQKTETKLQSKGLNKFEVLGLLIFSALNVYQDIKNQKS